MAADRFSFNKSWEHIQNKFVGTGHSDMTKFEWAANQHRDTLASHVGHYDMLSYFAVAQNDSIGIEYSLIYLKSNINLVLFQSGRVRYQILEVIIYFYYIKYLMQFA